MKDTLKFVIVGHVDHGKSTLIGRLLHDTNSLPPGKMEEIRRTSKELGRETEFAYLLDHLEEERQQGITIDTTQVFFKTDSREYVIIDAPGHVEFVKNMITGASQAEAALLIVDAEEGVKEQTKRHSTIISLLGIERVVVVINKMDLVYFKQETYTALKEEVSSFLAGFKVAPQEVIPISAMQGDNVANASTHMPWYTGPTVLKALDALANRSVKESLSALFAVQDVYKVADKRIAVGRVEVGTFLQDDKVAILPNNQQTAIRSIEKFLETPAEAIKGECTGFTTTDAVFLERGNILCKEGALPAVTNTFTAHVFWMSKKAYTAGEKVIIRCATQETSCEFAAITKRINSSTMEVIESDAGTLGELEIGEVSIKTKKPLVIETFNDLQELGRFVLVHDENIVAGGIVTRIDTDI